MKFLLDNWLLVLLALSSGGILLWSGLRSAGNSLAVNCAAAVRLMNHANAVVVDLRESQAFSSRHIRGAKNVPASELEQKLPQAVKNKNLPLIFVGSAGQSQSAIATARKLGYNHPHSLKGGLVAWQEANLPLEAAQ